MAHMKKDLRLFMGWVFMVCAGLAILPAVDVAVALASDCKVGIIDTAKIVLQSQYGEKMRAELAAEVEEQQKILSKKRETAEKQRDRLVKAKESGKSPSAIEKQEEEFQKIVRELKWMKEDLDKKLLEMDKELLEKMKRRVRIVLDQFLSRTDYCIIIEKQRVAVFSENVDVTDEVIKWLDSYRD